MKTRVAALAAVLVLVAAACGSRASKSDVQQADNASQNQVATNDTTATGPTFGTLPSPCGPGDASGATDVGVTNDSITIVAVADPGGAKPGLNQGVFDSMKAFGQWCNDQGGINGRKVNVELRDAKLFEYQQQVQYACDNALALVGSVAVLDDQGVQTQEDCKLPNIPGAAVSSEASKADYTYEPLPNPADEWLVGPGRWVAKTYPDAPPSAAILYTKVATTETISKKVVDGYGQVGFHFIYDEPTNIGEPSYAPLVVAMKNASVSYLNFISSFEEMVPLQKEMAQQDFKPLVELETNFYSYKYLAQAGAAAEGTLVHLTTWPFEEADQNPAMQQYLAALDAAVPGVQPEQLGVQAFSAALMWATAVKELGSNVTRTGLLEKLSEIHSWDAGGLHGTSDPGNHKAAGCFIEMQIDNGAFVRRYPLPDADKAVYDAGNGFDCSPDNMATLSSDYSSTGS